MGTPALTEAEFSGPTVLRDETAQLALLAAGALGMWMGVHAIRAFLTMVVWNVAEDAAPTTMGAVAGSVWIVGLLAWVPAALLRSRRPAWWFGVSLAVLSVLRQALVHETLTPLLAFATCVAWLWWCAAFVDELGRRAALDVAVPAILVGLAAQVAGQTSMHGMDLPMLTGIDYIVGAALLAAAFVVALVVSGTLAVGPKVSGRLGALAFGPYLFLQLTLLVNLGRLQMLASLDFPMAATVAEVALLVALASLWWAPAWPLRMALGVLAVLLLAVIDRLTGVVAGLALVVIQVGLAHVLHAAFAPATSRIVHTYGLFAGGGLLFFVLLFVYYSRNDWPLLWPVAAVLVVLPGALRRVRCAPFTSPRGLLASTAAALVAVGLSLVAASTAQPSNAPAPGELRVLNYNIHQSLDYWSLPSMRALGDFIQAQDPDVVALQEVNRGWNLSGGTDTVAWLRWRFPSYHIVFGPGSNDLFGNAIMSKYPITNWGWATFPRGRGQTPRGYVWALIPTQGQGGDLLFVSTHLSPYAGFDDDRATEASALLDFWAARPRALLAGDYNATPQDEAVRRLLAAGLKDVPAAHGLGQTPTYSSVVPTERIDYVFSTADLQSLSAEIPRTSASDHSPVAVVVRLP